MSSRSSRRSNRGRKAKLQKAMKEKTALEEELSRMNDAQEPEAIAKQIVDAVQKNAADDPLLNEENPFRVNVGHSFCTLL